MLSAWDLRFLSLAEHIAAWSKDPSTKVGAIVVRRDKTVASLGFNGFPRGVADDERLHNRAVKYEMVVHAEMNAILHSRESLAGCTLYCWPLPPCSRCAAAIIQSGVVRVVSPAPIERWLESCRVGLELLREAGVQVEWHLAESREVLAVGTLPAPALKHDQHLALPAGFAQAGDVVRIGSEQILLEPTLPPVTVQPDESGWGCYRSWDVQRAQHGTEAADHQLGARVELLGGPIT